MQNKFNRSSKVTSSKMKLVIFGWCVFQFVAVYVHMSLFTETAWGLILTPVVWQLFTELGYFLAHYLGYHSTPTGKTISNGSGGQIPFPDFVENDPIYLNQLRSLSLFEHLLRIIFSLSCALILGVVGILGLFVVSKVYNHLIIFIIGWLLLYFLLLFIWKKYQRIFAKIFNLDIAWYENNRPVYKKIKA